MIGPSARGAGSDDRELAQPAAQVDFTIEQVAELADEAREVEDEAREITDVAKRAAPDRSGGSLSHGADLLGPCGGDGARRDRSP
jgi:hypothetical protein